MSRYIRNTAILAKIESTYGTDSVPTGAANAMLVSDVSITPLDAQNVDRNLLRGFFGASEQLVGTATVRAGFSVEAAGSGTAGTAPAISPLLRACAMAEASLTTPARTEYTPVSTGLQSLTQHIHDDGLRHVLLGVRGNLRGSFRSGEIPRFAFEFTGLDGGVSAVGNPSLTLTAWRAPVVMTKANVVDITVGGTYAAGAVTGGTVYPSTGMEFDLGNQVNFAALLSSEEVDISDRSTTGSLQLDLTAAQEASLMNDVKANTPRSLSFVVGTQAGNRLLVFAPAVQFINPSKQELNGRRMIGFDLRFLPVNGNDEIRLVYL